MGDEMLKISRDEAAELVELLAYAIGVGDEAVRERANRWVGVLYSHAHGLR